MSVTGVQKANKNEQRTAASPFLGHISIEPNPVIPSALGSPLDKYTFDLLFPGLWGLGDG